MGGPTDEELQSDEFISRWLDKDLNSFERRLFKEALQRSTSEKTAILKDKDIASLKTRVEQQANSKEMLTELFRTRGVIPLPKIRNEIRQLVKKELSFDNFQYKENAFKQDEYLINQYVDGELDDNEITEKNISEIIESSSRNRELYQNLIRSKFATEDLFRNDDLKPSDNVVRQIDNMVASMDLDGDGASNLSGQKIMASQPSPPEFVEASYSMRANDDLMIENIEKQLEKKRNKKRFSFNNFSMPSIPQIASLAAVFVVGIVISPDIYQRLTPQNNNEEIILRSGESSLSSTTIEIKQNINLENKNEDLTVQNLAVTENFNPKKEIFLDYPFTLQFLAPINGDVTIHVNAVNETLKNKIEKGEKFDLGYFEKADVITFPKSGAIAVEQTDKLLRVDFIIESENEIIEITRWFEIINAGLELINLDE